MDQFTQLLKSAQGGHGVENLANLYGLSAQQTQRVMEALIPAFSVALQRAMQSPESLANLTILMMSGPYGGLYEHPPQKPVELAKPGDPVLEAVFGSPDVAKAVADHAASSSGLAAAVVKQVMPSFATLLLGGLAKSLAASGAMSQMLAASLARASGQQLPTGNPWVDALNNFISPPQAQQAPQSTGNPWVDAFAQMMVQSPFGLRGANARSNNPWQALAETISASMAAFQIPAQGWTAAPPPKAAPTPPPPPPEPANPALPFQDFFAKLFTQGCPPAFNAFDPSRSSGPTGFYPFDVWAQMLDRSSGRKG